MENTRATNTLDEAHAEKAGATAPPEDEKSTHALPAGKQNAGSLNINTQERQLIERALQDCGGNRTEAAKRLGISRRTLHRKLKSYGLGAS